MKVKVLLILKCLKILKITYKSTQNSTQMKTIVTLSNGKRVANFSSPHPFTFTDGSVLPAVSNEEAERLKVTFIESKPSIEGDISLSFELSDDVLREMDKWVAEYQNGNVDVIFCPLPMITAIRENKGLGYSLRNRFRAIRIEDRIKKLVSIDKQCL